MIRYWGIILILVGVPTAIAIRFWWKSYWSPGEIRKRARLRQLEREDASDLPAFEDYKQQTRDYEGVGKDIEAELRRKDDWM